MEILTPNNPEIQFNSDLNLIREYDNQHYLDRLYIYWDICTTCNFNCSYCYARKEYTSDEWNQVYPWSHQILVLKALSLSKYPLFLGFHGGEPSIHPRFTELIQETLKILTHKDSRLYIVTNGLSKNLLKIPYNHKVYFLMSSHMEYKKLYGDHYEKYLNNVRELHNRGFKVKCNILLLPQKEYWYDIHFLYEELSKIGVIIHPHFIYELKDNKEIIYNYSKEFYNEFKELRNTECKYIFETDHNTHIKVSDYDLFKNNLNHFKGWNCYNNNFEIKYDGFLRRICTNDLIDLKKNPLYLKNFKITPIKCDYDCCMSDGVLKCLKTR